MEIRLARQEDKEAWDAYVNNRPDAAPYCLFAWKQAIEEVYGHKACYLLAEKENTIIGILPLIHFRIPFLSTSLISLPYCDVGDILADSNEIRKKLAKEALFLAEKMRPSSLEIRSSKQNLIENDFDWTVSVQTEKVRMLLNLPDSSEELWKGFKSKLRSQINKAEKNNLTFAWGTTKDIDPFYEVFSRNMHDLGSPVHSKKWIEKIIEYYGENAVMGLVYNEKQPVGCGIILFTKHTASIPWASTLREFNRLNPNMMLYWNFLKFAADHNKKLFDFGRSTPNEGTFRFKKQWGATPRPLLWYQVGEEKNIQKTEIKQSTKREILADIWSKMPLPMANFFGPKIRKYISL